MRMLVTLSLLMVLSIGQLCAEPSSADHSKQHNSLTKHVEKTSHSNLADLAKKPVAHSSQDAKHDKKVLQAKKPGDHVSHDAEMRY